MNFEQLLRAWNNVFGKRTVLTTALHWQASNGNQELAAALGSPLPSVNVLGRLLAALSGQAIGGLKLVRCPGRIGNCASWRVERINQNGAPLSGR